MAGALVGGSFLSASLQVLFDRMASRQILDFFKGQKLNDRLLQKLKILMISVNGVLDDAEEKQISKPAVKEWLDELKHAVYEADDLLDEISYEALRLQFEAADSPQTSTDQVINLFSSLNPFKESMEGKLGEILGSLEYLVKLKDALGLKEGIGENSSFWRMPTTSLVDESEIYGRDDDKVEILNFLLSDDPNGNEVGVIPIVGMGGVGKTTLAQFLYSDSQVKEWFDLRIWVCVSEEFDVFRVTKDILKEVDPVSHDEKTPNQLQLELQGKLKEKKFLLVLDDVWNDQYVDWDKLRKPLKAGARGSKIVVTTRNEDVASIMRTVPTHHLMELTDDDCWSLFEKHAFDDGNSDTFCMLEVIGREIVRKCNGLPLAAKALGGLLRCKRDVEEWNQILKSDIWDLPDKNILPALRLSYHHLPPPLKQCFAYCAIIPKNCEFVKEELVLLWMAEGFLVQSKDDIEMEEIGNRYFNDLVSRSFFHQSNAGFVMHDLINDLAKYVSGEFCFCLEDGNSCKVTKKARHLLYAAIKHDASKKYKSICEAKFLRTFLPKGCMQMAYRTELVDNKVIHKLLPNLKHLRVLALFYWDNSIELLDSIDHFKHLRYLDLHHASIQRLPESVTGMYNLQTLILWGCNNLIELPTNMGRLVNLHHLDITGTKLQEMPSQMDKLTKLHTLTNFILGKSGGYRIKELGDLQHLRKLGIQNLQNVKDARNALGANLKDKKHLKMLKLTWDGIADNSQHERHILESLEPNTKVQNLSIDGYGGTKFPKWVGDSSFSNIISLSLIGCKYCSSLPSLGQLASLKDLWIIAFDGVVVVGHEFYGCTSMKKPFGSLEILSFQKMSQLHEWISYEDGAFPLLKKLYIIDCPNLKGALPSHLPSLKELHIEGCNQLVASLPRAPNMFLMLRDSARDLLLEKSVFVIHKFPLLDFVQDVLEQMGIVSTTLEEICITACYLLKCLPLELFPKIKSLLIVDCPSLESLCASEATYRVLTSFSSLTIYSCTNLESFPKGGLHAPNLTCLSLFNCSKLNSLPEFMQSLLSSLVELSIFGCPELKSFPEGGLPSKLESLSVRSCKKLIDGRRQWDLQKLLSLSVFSIGGYKEMKSFPEETLLPSSLTHLTISSLENLEFLNYKELQHLTSLIELNIQSCPKLHSMPEWGLPPKLESISIDRCNKLFSGNMLWNLQMLPCLTHFSICECENVESFPEERLLPSTLTSLEIESLENLKSLNYKGLQHLTSLTELKIEYCTNLQSLPEEGLPSSLSSLYICSCPLLVQRCQQEKGEDWSKISHIPDIQIRPTC